MLEVLFFARYLFVYFLFLSFFILDFFFWGETKKKAVSSFHLIQLVFFTLSCIHSLPAGFFRTRCGDRQSVAAPFSSSSSSIRRHHMRIKSRRGFFQIKFDQKARAVSTRDSWLIDFSFSSPTGWIIYFQSQNFFWGMRDQQIVIASFIGGYNKNI